MPSISYWITIESASGWFDLYCNDRPVVRLRGQRAFRRPINEYLSPGENAVCAKAPRPGSTGAPNGEAKLLIQRAVFTGFKMQSLDTVLERTFDAAPLASPDASVALGGFRPELSRYAALPVAAQPIGAAERTLIRAKLEEVASWWRDGDSASLSAWIEPALRAFTDANPEQSPSNYLQSYARMLSVMFHQPRRVELGAVDLDVCGGGRLADCLGAEGVGAIQVRLQDGTHYDMRVLVGVWDGRVHAVR